MAYSIWRNELITPLAQQLVSHIIKLIGRLRTGTTSSIGINTSDIRGAVLSFVEVNEPVQQEQKTPFSLSNAISRTEVRETISNNPLTDRKFSFTKICSKGIFWRQQSAITEHSPMNSLHIWIVARIWNL